MSLSRLTSNFEFNKFALLLSKYEYKIKVSDILAGVIIGLEATHALVDLGLKKVAFLPLREISTKDPNSPNQFLEINFIGEFFILSYNKTTDQIIVSLKETQSLYLWERLKQIDFRTTIFYAQNEQTLGRGRILSSNGLKFYALNLHIPKYYRRQKDKKFLMPFKFIEIKDFIHIVQVNARLALFAKFSRDIKIGQIYCGNIISIKTFGVFLNILGIQSLLHISEISRQKISNLRELYKQGNQIKVRILYKNLEQGKISLTLRLE